MNSLRSCVRSIVALFGVFLLCSCRDEGAQTRIAQIEAHLEKQREGQAKFVEWVVDRDKKVGEQITFMAKEVFKEFQEKYAVIDPNGQGFATVESNNGTFLVSCKAAEAHLDGHKLTLNIGNPYFMTYSGFTLRVKFGTRPPEYPKDATPEQLAEWQKANAEWQKTLKQKELAFTEELAAGAWTKAEMILAPSKPEEVGHVSISMTTNKVSLRKPNE